MAVPEQVQRQIDRSKELVAKLNADKTSDNEPVTPTVDNPPVISEDRAPADVGAKPPAVDEYAQLQHKHSTLQGMFNSQKTQISELQAQVNNLQGLIASISAQPKPPAAEPPKPTTFITEDEVKEYGDSIEVMRKAAREEAANTYLPMIEELKNQVSKLTNLPAQVETLHKQNAVTTEQLFWDDLTYHVPSWQTINKDPAFHGWLLQVDPMTGMTRQTYLDNAQKNLDAARVVAIFHAWEAIKAPPAPTPNTPNPAKAELEQQVAPGRSRSAPPVTDPTKKMYSQEDIANFYRAVTRGDFRGKDAEKAAIEHDIFMAQKDGRIK